MALIAEKTFGDSLNVLDSEIGLVVKTRQATQDMAEQVNARLIIKAGSLFTNPDNKEDIGVFFEDIDITDDAARPVPVIVEGRVRADRVSDEVTATADALAAIGVKLV